MTAKIDEKYWHLSLSVRGHGVVAAVKIDVVEIGFAEAMGYRGENDNSRKALRIGASQ